MLKPAISAANAPISTLSMSVWPSPPAFRLAIHTAFALRNRVSAIRVLAQTEVITKAQHCRSEVYLGGYGWVPVDAADVRKVVLEEPPGNRPLDDDGEASTNASVRIVGDELARL